MHYYEVAPNKIIRIDSNYFTYSSELILSIGQIVLIEVGKKYVTGVILKQVEKPAYPTKSIISIIEQTPLPKQLVDLSLWMSEYYVAPLANVLQTMLPNGLCKARKPQTNKATAVNRNRTNNVFNNEQHIAFKTYDKFTDGTFLLQGVTGSGKTELYIAMAKQALLNKSSAIILVPEIALTSQLISQFSQHFDNLLVTHSKMTEASRHHVWKEALECKIPRIVIGPRSAIFTPLANIGVIIIDEAHEPSFKQEQSPKYSALRVATILGRLHHARVVFGSATPNVVDRYLAEKSDRPILKLSKPARLNATPPTITLVDMTKRNNFNGHRFLSKQLVEQIYNTLRSGDQTLIFHNRRGSSSTTLCENCGWTAECPRCFLPLTMHADKHSLQCHICGYNTQIPTSCPNCNDVNIIYKGIGTKLIETELHKLFPEANIARFDADNKEDEAVNARYSELYNGTIDIAIGTQVVAKGLDLPHLKTVGVIQADSGLSIPDFNTNERTFQLIAQVVGRVGRNEDKTNVIVQTYQPNHPSIVCGLTQDYESFYNQIIQERQRGIFPPFTHLLKLTCSYKTELVAIKNTKKLTDELRKKINDSAQIFGPIPAFYERQRGMYRWQIILKSPKRKYLTEALKYIPSKYWQSELDPTSLL